MGVPEADLVAERIRQAVTRIRVPVDTDAGVVTGLSTSIGVAIYPDAGSGVQELLDAADELFFTRGIAATPIDAVLERAGVSAATLYRGYPSKDALVAATLERRHSAWIETWDAAVAAQATDEGRLLAIFDALDAFRSQPAGSRWCGAVDCCSKVSTSSLARARRCY